MYTVYWYRYHHGKEDEAMTANWRDFDSLEKAINFLDGRAKLIKSINWAGGHVEDENRNWLYEIDWEGNEEDNREKFDTTDTEPETATDSETTETETATDTEVGKFVYDVRIHNDYGWDTYTVRADGLESAEYKAVRRMELETDEEEYSSIDSIRIYEENSDELLKEIIFEPSETKDTGIDDIKKFIKAKDDLAVDQFERLTRTLYKSLFKAIGLEETRKIHFIISNNMVFFNYNGTHYKYYPSQCKVFKKCGRKYQRINWKDFAKENNLDGQKQNTGRSPPFTPDIRSTKND